MKLKNKIELALGVTLLLLLLWLLMWGFHGFPTKSVGKEEQKYIPPSSQPQCAAKAYELCA